MVEALLTTKRIEISSYLEDKMLTLQSYHISLPSYHMIITIQFSRLELLLNLFFCLSPDRLQFLQHLRPLHFQCMGAREVFFGSDGIVANLLMWGKLPVGLLNGGSGMIWIIYQQDAMHDRPIISLL